MILESYFLFVLWEFSDFDFDFAASIGNADIIQPGLLQLQPNFDDFLMDTLEPLPSLQGELAKTQNFGLDGPRPPRRTVHW